MTVWIVYLRIPYEDTKVVAVYAHQLPAREHAAILNRASTYRYHVAEHAVIGATAVAEEV